MPTVELKNARSTHTILKLIIRWQDNTSVNWWNAFHALYHTKLSQCPVRDSAGTTTVLRFAVSVISGECQDNCRISERSLASDLLQIHHSLFSLHEESRGRGMWYVLGKWEVHTEVWRGNLREKGHLEYLDVSLRIILKWTFKKYDGAYTKFLWFSMETCCCQRGMWVLGFINSGNFLTSLGTTSFSRRTWLHEVSHPIIGQLWVVCVCVCMHVYVCTHTHTHTTRATASVAI